MKRILVLTIMIALGSAFSASHSFADEYDGRGQVADTKPDPNEAKSVPGDNGESAAAATAACQACLTGLKGGRMLDNTVYREGSNGSFKMPDGSAVSKGTGGAQ